MPQWRWSATTVGREPLSLARLTRRVCSVFPSRTTTTRCGGPKGARQSSSRARTPRALPPPTWAEVWSAQNLLWRTGRRTKWPSQQGHSHSNKLPSVPNPRRGSWWKAQPQNPTALSCGTRPHTTNLRTMSLHLTMTTTTTTRMDPTGMEIRAGESIMEALDMADVISMGTAVAKDLGMEIHTMVIMDPRSIVEIMMTEMGIVGPLTEIALQVMKTPTIAQAVTIDLHLHTMIRTLPLAITRLPTISLLLTTLEATHLLHITIHLLSITAHILLTVTGTTLLLQSTTVPGPLLTITGSTLLRPSMVTAHALLITITAIILLLLNIALLPLTTTITDHHQCLTITTILPPMATGPHTLPLLITVATRRVPQGQQVSKLQWIRLSSLDLEDGWICASMAYSLLGTEAVGLPSARNKLWRLQVPHNCMRYIEPGYMTGGDNRLPTFSFS